MCKNIVKKANLPHPVLIYDILEERTRAIHESLGPQRMIIAQSIGEATSKADVIFFSVPNDEAVRAVMDQILAAGVAGKVVVNCSTVHPDTSAQEAGAVTAAGGSFVACPVFGSAQMAEAGQIVAVLASDTPAAADKVMPLCKGVMARDVIDVCSGGRGDGDAAAAATTAARGPLLLKIIGNMFALNIATALAEAHVLAEKAGLGSDQFHQFVQTLFPGPSAAYSHAMLSGSYHRQQKPQGPALLAKKDAQYAQSLASEAGVRLRTLEVAQHYVGAVLQHKGDDGAMAGVYGAARLEAGLPYEN
ncbi:uncharacterized protein Z520_06439 [Fonsecaea multimorphosa CBS 102226]|uniref:6-phosphogluconate dehydrogenase NADP-binding domain-containing protein n=1 Tax=Fonsecaea multimorphosa CBS 102226 TaxID=1442371 RepID=A0A0D2IKX1_9EURO|nr:uncharacterized protein Z520_06439 [Fonsecaea multimorphosa CBS 102226]KIX97661.1 hypothetical protein Z520_06439 [Fonsecaea multimorphosa CBS 102226]OAL23979.1 hypothetical protein AYO22_06003 [Fonsecaea multimorphosa]